MTHDRLPTSPSGVPGPDQHVDVLSDTEHQPLAEPAPMPVSMAPTVPPPGGGRPQTDLTTQLLALLADAGLGEGQMATTATGSGTYVGPTTLVWFDLDGVPRIDMVRIESDDRVVLVPWHAVRSIEPAVPPADA